MTSLNDLYQDARKALRDGGIESADLDARLLVAYITGHAPEDVLLKPDATVHEGEAILKDAIARRLKREPVSKITGHREFYGFDFIVSRDVLDPRPDSETLIDAARAHLTEFRSAEILDICTGSGCLLVTLLTLF
ncbi:MAG TPA: peptide chain release factor N(5)-glutamine methyltransferase, partial [Alphaproteobacteria bacterium]